MDLILTGANALTMDPSDLRAEAVAVRDGKIAAVGTSAEVAKLAGPDTEMTHLAGRTLIPGFIDPHNHFHMTTFQRVSVDCSTPPHNTVRGVLEAIAVAVGAAAPGRWVSGWGFRVSGVKENRGLLRDELDEVAPDNPLCIVDASVHAAYANSAALKLAEIGRDTPDPLHGQFHRDVHGEADGTLWEAAMDPVYALSLRAMLDYHGDNATDLVRDNCMRHVAKGITSVGDALVVAEAAELYRHTEALGKLPIVLHQMLGGDTFFAHPEGPAKGHVGDGNISDRLRGGTVKMFMDPAFPSAAFIKFHAHGGEEQIGQPYYTQDEANEIVISAHERGMQVAIHCLGTWSIEQALNAFEAALKRHPAEEPRFRIEHYWFPTLAQIKRSRSLGVVASVQPPFVQTFGQYSKDRAEEMGGDVRVFPMRTMLSEGLTVAASSDCPCAVLDPLAGLYAIVTRRTTPDGERIVPDEAVTPLQGLRMYTLNSAYAMSRESEVGSLEVGKRADMAVLSHDPTAVDPEFIRDITVDLTYVEGRLLYKR